MKNGSIENSSDLKIVERCEQAKKTYRYVSDVARRLSEAAASIEKISDLFTIHIEVQRQKLRDNCEKLFFLDPMNYGKKSVELLWRKVYYDTISTAKKLRETDNDCDNYLEMHIVCGIGHFHHFITRVQSEMKIKLKEFDYAPLYNDEEFQDDINYKPPDDEYSLCKSVLYSCLIYLGDLSRYHVEIFNKVDSSVAARYYLQAAQLELTSGMPFNQLGNLYLEKNYNLDSVSSYIHCLSCITPFEGAMGNLTKIFEKNTQFCSMFTESESWSQAEHVQITVANFLSLIEKWYFSKDDDDITKLCSTVIQHLKLALDFTKTSLPDINKNYNEYVQAAEEENASPAYLNPLMIHNIVKICLFTIAKLKETNESKSFACKAFTLAFLSQVLQKLHSQLENLGFKNPADNYTPKSKSKQPEPNENGIDKSNVQGIQEEILNGMKESSDITEAFINSCDGDKEVFVNGDAKNKKILARRRRRRRAASSNSSDASDSESSDHSIESSSEMDETTDSSYPSEDEKSDGSTFDGMDEEKEEVNSTWNNSIKIKDHNTDIAVEIANDNAVELSNQKDSEEKLKSEHYLDVEGIKKFLLGDNILPSLKLLQDWILTEKELILSCGDSGESLFKCVINLLNIFQYYFNNKNSDLIKNNCKILIQAKHIARKYRLEYKSIPLPEDINLRGTNIGKFDKDAAEWQLMDKLKLTEYEENIIRILNFIDFGNQVAKIVPRIKFNRTMKIFYFKKMYPPKVSTKLNHKRSREWHNSKKQDGSTGKYVHFVSDAEVDVSQFDGKQNAKSIFITFPSMNFAKHLSEDVKLHLEAFSSVKSPLAIINLLGAVVFKCKCLKHNITEIGEVDYQNVPKVIMRSLYVDKNESGLLRRLGHLWLTSKVRELECTGQTEAPSLLAVDTAALCKHLRRVKQLLRTRNFIFLVPSVVLQELDELKRDCSSARDAIRWLELQLKSGSRFLRTQRPGQTKPLSMLKYPRKAPSFVHNFMQILEFCNHFSDEKQQGGNGDAEGTVHGKSSPLLVLLLGNELGKNEEQHKEFSLLGTAQAAGISVEYFGEFYAKWRQTNHKNGKKR